MCDQFWIEVVTTKYCQAKIDNTKSIKKLCLGAENIDATNKRSIKSENNLHETLKPSIFQPLAHNDPMFHEVVSPQSSSEATAHIALRIHVRLGLEEPLDHRVVESAGCQIQRCVASGAAARGQAAGRTQRRKFEAIELIEKAISARSAVNMIWINLKTYKNIKFRDSGTLA